MRRRFTFVMGCLVLSAPVAADDDVDSLFDLPLEKLVKLQVSVSSNFQQSVGNTPGIVRVIDREKIEKNGWRDLQQLLMHIPGVQISVSKNGHSNIWMRGVQNRNNNKVLLLVDGVPQEDAYYGNFNINNQLPMQQVERVEVLNGPGGVVHGANSFAGVISITTRSEGRRVGAVIGQKNSYTSASSTETVNDAEIYADYDWKSEFGNFYLFARGKNDQGVQPQYNREGEYYDRDADSKSQYFLGKYHYKDLNLQVSHSDYSYPYRYTSSERWQGYDKQLSTATGDYKYQISDALSMKLSGYYKHYDFSRPKKSFDGSRIESTGSSFHDTSASGADALFLWPLSENKHVSFGFNYSSDWARNTYESNTDYPLDSSATTLKEETLVDDIKSETIGTFAEYQQNAFSDHWLHLGLRYDKLSDFDDQFDYRIGLTKETDLYNYKVLYGTAYRVPTFREYLKKYSDDYTQKNPLQPEQMQTLELAAGFTVKNHDLQLVWYFNQYQEFIKEVTVNSVDGIEIDSGSGDEYGFNLDEIEVSGLEFIWTWNPVNNLSLNTNLAYLLTATEDPGRISKVIVSPDPINTEKSDLPSLSDLTATVQLSYQFYKDYSLYWDIIYYSDRGMEENYQADSAIQSPENSDSIWLSNLSLQVDVTKELSLSIGVNNLFDSDVYSPSIDPVSDYDSQWPGRRVELGVQWQF